MQVTELPIRRWTQDYKEFLEVRSLTVCLPRWETS